ncbi:MAG: hypothetical protein HGB12_09505 [Bacteroidetes bacterium]|nr:hypothetical protein [Bacteroidota bacterium]
MEVREVSTIWYDSLMPSIVDYGVILIFLFIIFFAAMSHQNKNIDSNPAYKYFISGLFFKIFCGFGLCTVYTLYYGGGDTHAYFISSKAMVNVLLQKGPEPFFRLLLGDQSNQAYAFDSYTGLVFYWHDIQAWTIIRFTSIFTIFSFKSYYTATLLLDVCAFVGVWKLYLTFTEIYPDYKNKLAIGILFVPSIVFWGSGIMKDTFTLSAACWLTHNFYKIFIKKENIFSNICLMIINIYIIISLKPYIIVALLPGILIWISFNYVKSVENKILRTLFTPFLIVFGFGVGAITLTAFSGSLGDYANIQSASKKAQITQQDLLRSDAYGANNYDLGSYEATPTGMIKKAPMAILTVLFRPFLWEAKNPVMLISGLENTIILLMTIFILFKVGVIKTFKIIGSEPFLFFSLLFAVIFSFSVGVAAANFGAMVRYRIPCMIFYIPTLIILYERMKSLKKDKETSREQNRNK